MGISRLLFRYRLADSVGLFVELVNKQLITSRIDTVRIPGAAIRESHLTLQHSLDRIRRSSISLGSGFAACKIAAAAR